MINILSLSLFFSSSSRLLQATATTKDMGKYQERADERELSSLPLLSLGYVLRNAFFMQLPPGDLFVLFFLCLPCAKVSCSNRPLTLLSGPRLTRAKGTWLLSS